MEGLVVPGILPPELQQLDATALLQATDILDMDSLDELLSQVPDRDEIQVEPDSCTNEHESNGGERETSAASGRFASPVGDKEIKLAQETSVPTNTKKSTTWAVKVWKDWSSNRRVVSPSDWPPHLFLCSTRELNRWLSRFILEVRRQDGKNYPPNTLYQLCCGVMRYVREVKPELDIFKDPTFADFRKTLDAEMKRLRSLGHGTRVKQAEPISETEEDHLWSKGKLGSQTPQSLLDTMVFMCGLYFGLRSGKEHRNLTTDQLELVEPPDGVPHLIYTENVSKNNPGGLYNRKIKPKVVIHHANLTDPARCFVTFYKAYMAHRPKPENVQHNAFYLSPKRNPNSQVLYSTCPVGYHTLANTVKRLCKVAEGQENQAAANPPIASQHTTTGSTSLDVATTTSGFGNGGVSFSGCHNITVNYYCERK